MWIPKGATLIRGRRLFEVRRLLEEIRQLISNQCSTHMKTTCITNQLTGLKHWLEVG